MQIVYLVATNGPWRKLKGGEFAVITIFSRKRKCHTCYMPQVWTWAQDCYCRTRWMKETRQTNEQWCSLHRMNLHDNNACRSQQQQLNSGNNPNNRDGQRNDQHQHRAKNNIATTVLDRANTTNTTTSYSRF